MAKSAASARNDAIVSLSKRRGFVFPSSEIYGGTRSAWDYGPLGVELKENVRRQWWKSMVQQPRRHRRPRLGGHPRRARCGRPPVTSTTFTDPLVECQSLPQAVPRRPPRGGRTRRSKGRAPENGLADVPCPNCGTKGAWTEPRQFNGLLKTYLGPVEDEEGLHYLRPETAQGIFVNFLNVMTVGAQEAAVRHRADRQVVPQRDHAGQLHLPHARVRADGDGVLRRAGHRRGVARVLAAGALELVRRPRHRPGEPALLRAPARRSSSHYSKRTVDIEYRFRFGGKEFAELEGIANRTDFDLKTHSQALRRRPDATSTRRRTSAGRRTSSSRRPV